MALAQNQNLILRNAEIGDLARVEAEQVAA
jgi:hypothetical protein